MIDISSFQVGDKILVDPYLHKGYDYSVYANSMMEEYAGMCVTISMICGSHLLIKEDKGEWWWSNDMFFPYETIPQIKLSDYIM